MTKLQTIIACLTCMAISNIYAESNPKDFCAELPGFWHGETHIKNQTTCNLTNGCTHLVMGAAEKLKDNTYHMKLTYTDGTGIQKQELDITCENGNIVLPVPAKYTIAETCDSINHCYLVYDDTRFSAELIKG